MSDGIEIRAFTDGDLSGVVAALARVHATDGYPVEGVERPETWISSPSVEKAWVAVMQDMVVGHVALMSAESEDANRLWRESSPGDEKEVKALARLFVLREARSRRIGERLVKAVMGFASERGIRLVLDVMLKDAAAIRLYERLGWSRIGLADHHYGGSEVVPAACYVWPNS